ncbi:MAG: hypothetical protein HOW73_18645 [Polyangiaceae bacterium]|nr:hypothetical protein [Polyangiaceae bacterium]
MSTSIFQYGSLFLAALIVSACSGASDGAKPAASEPGNAAPSSDALVEMVRTSKVPGTECAGPTSESTLGGAYAAQVTSLKEMADRLKIGLIEEGSCKPASEEDVSRLAKSVPQAVWYCNVGATPDYSKLQQQPGEEEIGTNFSVGFALDSAGAIIPASLTCVAAG